MIRNYILVFIRNILRYKTFSVINVLGLVLGISCFSIIMLYAEFEMGYDQFHRDSADIYRIVKDFVSNDGVSVPDATTPAALTVAIRSAVPEVESITRFLPNGGRRNLFQHQDKQFYELQLLRVDSAFFHVFDFEFVSGDMDQPFRGAHSMVITESIARKYFGEEDPIGKIIQTNLNQIDYLVSAVIKDVPANAHYTFQILIPFANPRNLEGDWTRHSFYTYAKLKHGVDPQAFQKKVQQIVSLQPSEQLNRYHIQPVEGIHLNSRLKSELGQNGDIRYIRILIVIGIFVLVIAGVNYVNLVTAQSLKRAKEIGVRKVTGAFRYLLVIQFLVESVAMALIAAVIALTLVLLVLPYLQPMLGVDLSPRFYGSDAIRLMVPISVVCMGVLAGIYPAIYLSSFRPLNIVRGRLHSTTQGIRLRQGLVVFQFVISGSLIVGFMVIRQQIDFIRTKDLGFDAQSVLVIPGISEIRNVEAVAEDFRKITGVQRVARASGGVLGLQNAINGVADQHDGTRIPLNFMQVDYDFVATLDIEVVEGRNFSPSFPSDTTAILLNEASVRQLALPEPVVGQTLSWDDQSGNTRNVQIVGIVRDFHFTSFHDQIKPFGFILGSDEGATFFIRTNGDDVSVTLAEIERIWRKHSDDKPIDFTFQEDYMKNLHASERQFQQLFSAFTLLAMVVACLGLFGLVTALSEAKTKEIGIRKILGSGVTGIVGLLSREFIGLVVLAFIMAVPLSFLVMRTWLDGFAYRVTLGWEVFAMAGGTTLLIAVVTICFQSARAALVNPIHSLRSE